MDHSKSSQQENGFQAKWIVDNFAIEAAVVWGAAECRSLHKLHLLISSTIISISMNQREEIGSIYNIEYSPLFEACLIIGTTKINDERGIALKYTLRKRKGFWAKKARFISIFVLHYSLQLCHWLWLMLLLRDLGAFMFVASMVEIAWFRALLFWRLFFTTLFGGHFKTLLHEIEKND